MADCTCDNLTVGSNGLKINGGVAEPPASNTPWQAFKSTQFANLLPNGSFESWTAGTSSPPDGWIHGGGNGTINREGTIVKLGAYSARVASDPGAGNSKRLRYNGIPVNDYKGKTVTFGAWVYATTTTADKVRLEIYDNTLGFVGSPYHSGNPGWEFLTVSHAISSSATVVLFDLHLNSPSVTAYMDGAILTEGPVALGFAPKALNDTDAQTAYGQTSFMSNVGIGTPAPGSRLHMKTKDDQFWSPLTIEAESTSGGDPPGSKPEHSANALEFKRSRAGGADAIAYDDLGNIFFSFKKAEAPGGWVEGASIDSRIVNVGANTGQWAEDKVTVVGELTANIIVAGEKREFLRCTVGKLSIGDGWLRVGPALISTQHFARYGRMGEEAFMTNNAWYDGTDWQRDNLNMGLTIFQVRRDRGLRWHSAPPGANPVGTYPDVSTGMVLQGYVVYRDATATGDMYIDGSYFTFSPTPPKDEKDMAPEEWLDWALADAKKPRKPYPGLAEDPEEIKKYAKDVSRIAIGVARYAEHLRTAVVTLEKRVAELEGRARTGPTSG